MHQDVILECIDDLDISIRTRALDLVVGMVNSDNIVVVIERLLSQLRTAPYSTETQYTENDRTMQGSVLPAADLNEEEAEESLRLTEGTKEIAPLPEEYRVTVIKRILEICSGETYARIYDFEWYIGVLIQMVRVSPSIGTQLSGDSETASNDFDGSRRDISYEIGYELQNVAVRVKSVRPEATRAAQSLLMVDQRDQNFPSSGNGGQHVLESAAWLVGEYADHLSDPSGVLTSLLHPSVLNLPERIIATILQAIHKVFSWLVGDQFVSWTREKKTIVTLLLARIINFLEPLTTSPSFEVQERAVQFLELMRLSAEAAEAQEPKNASEVFAEPPLLLTQAIPSLFSSLELNPVAPGAQRKVPVPEDLKLDTPINPYLHDLLSLANEYCFDSAEEEDDSHRFYYQQPKKPAVRQAAADRLPSSEVDYGSYQQSSKEEILGADAIARLKAERQERYKDDPFYIAPESEQSTASPIHDILRSTQSADVDIDSIPVIELENTDLKYQQPEGNQVGVTAVAAANSISSNERSKSRKTVEILLDETLGTDDLERSSLQSPGNDTQRPELVRPTQSRAKKSLLQVDSSGLGALSLDDNGRAGVGDGTYNSNGNLNIERREAEEAEMARAVQEVERLRLEMQRAAERIQARDAPPEGTLVQKKKKKRKVLRAKGESDDSRIKKTKEIHLNEDSKGYKADDNNTKEENGNLPIDGAEVLTKTKKKKKKKREVRFDDKVQ